MIHKTNWSLGIAPLLAVVRKVGGATMGDMRHFIQHIVFLFGGCATAKLLCKLVKGLTQAANLVSRVMSRPNNPSLAGCASKFARSMLTANGPVVPVFPVKFSFAQCASSQTVSNDAYIIQLQLPRL